MLGTLMKYELKSVGRILLPLYGAWIIAAVLLGTSIGNDIIGNSSAFIALSGILYGGATMAAIILTCIILIQRFYKNLLGNEGYLMFALPVSTGNHIINKIFSGAIWGTLGIIVAIISALTIAGCIEGFGYIFQNFNYAIGQVNVLNHGVITIILTSIELIAIVFLAFGVTAAKVYTAIAIGHQLNSHRILGSIGGYIGLSIIESILGNILGEIFDTGIIDVYFNLTANMSGIAQSHLTMIIIMIFMAIVAAIYGAIAWKLLDKRLNLE